MSGRSGILVDAVVYTGHRSAVDRLVGVADRILAGGKYGCRLEAVAVAKTRNNDQNAKFHAICRDISLQKEWAGRRRLGDDWKRLLVDAWCREAHRTASLFVPSLDGSGVVALGAQTRRLSVADMAELIDFAIAWCDQEGVVLSEPKTARGDHDAND